MLRITKRISNGSTIIGYALTDGNQEVQMDKPSVMNMAKQGLIMNVKVSGDTISGTNGFELKSLPTINTKQQENNFQIHEKLAAVVRHLDEIGTVPSLESMESRRSIDNMGSRFIQQEIVSGKLRKDMMHVNSGNIQIIKRFGCGVLPSLIAYFKKYEQIPEEKKKQIHKQLKGALGLAGLTSKTISKSESDVIKIIIDSVLPIVRNDLQSVSHQYIGYLVRTSSDLRSGLKYQKLMYGTGEVLGEGMLYGDSTALLTRAELVALASRATISGELGDFIMKLTSRKVIPTNKWEYMQNHIFQYRTSDADIEYSDIVDLKQIIEPEVMRRFLPQDEVTNLLEAISESGILCRVINASLIKVGGTKEEYDRQQGVVSNVSLMQIGGYKGENDKALINIGVKSNKQKQGLFSMFKR